MVLFALLRPIAVLTILATTATMVRAQVVEEFTIDEGGRMGEKPLLHGNLVVWQRYGPRDENGRQESPDLMLCKDISWHDQEEVEVAEYSAVTGVLNDEYLFWDSPVRARSLEDLIVGEQTNDVIVSATGRAIAANKEFVFLRRLSGSNGYFAKRLDRLDDPSQDSIRLVTDANTPPSILIGSAAVGSEYFVWQDTEERLVTSWKIYAKPLSELFDPESRTLVMDTELKGSNGSFLAISGNLLVFQAANPDSEQGLSQIYFVDLGRDEEPTPVAEPDATLNWFQTWPSIGEDYVVWAESSFFTRKAYAKRIIDGRPQGQKFLLSDSDAAGSWITISGNIATWNGSTSIAEGEALQAAVVAVELEDPDRDGVGDVDQDGRVNITDAIAIVNFLFQNGWRPRLRLADENQSGTIAIDDAIAILERLFTGSRS